LKKGFLLIGFVCILGKLLAQKDFKYNFEPIKNVNFTERRAYFAKTYPNILEQNDSIGRIKAYEFLRQYLSFAKASGNDELVTDAEFSKFYYDNKNTKELSQGILDKYNTFYKIAKAKNYEWLKVNSSWAAGTDCFNKSTQYEKGFEYYLRLEEDLKSLSADEFKDKSTFVDNLSANYLRFEDYPSCRRISIQGIVELGTKSNLTHRLFNNIGLSYMREKQYDSALNYFNQGIAYIKKNKQLTADWIGIIHGNMGEAMLEQNKFEAAKPYVIEDLSNALTLGDKGLAANAYINLAIIHTAEKNASAADTCLNKAKYLLEQYYDLKKTARLYDALSKVEMLKGNTAKSNEYLQKTIVLKDSLNKLFNSSQILRASQRAFINKENEFKDKQHRRELERNVLIGGILLLGALGIFVYYNQRKRYIQQQKIQSLELENKEQELKMAKLELSEFALGIANKNQELELMQMQINNNTATPSEALANELVQASILTDDDWDKFKNLFNKVHIGFLARLKDNLPELTPAETRYIVLAKLGFDNKTMANTMGISTASVRVLWHRLKKKININEELSVDEWIRGI
jgi:DNA-binding CsgD family transcriptional regulator